MSDEPINILSNDFLRFFSNSNSDLFDFLRSRKHLSKQKALYNNKNKHSLAVCVSGFEGFELTSNTTFPFDRVEKRTVKFMFYGKDTYKNGILSQDPFDSTLTAQQRKIYISLCRNAVVVKHNMVPRYGDIMILRQKTDGKYQIEKIVGNLDGTTPPVLDTNIGMNELLQAIQNGSLQNLGNVLNGGSSNSRNFTRVDVEGGEFKVDGVIFKEMPTPDVADKAESLVESAKAAAKAGGDPYVSGWSMTPSGKKWVRLHMWNDAPAEKIKMHPGSGNWQDSKDGSGRDAADMGAHWSGCFFKRSHENYIEPKQKDGGNGISNWQSEYNWADAAMVRQRVFADPASFAGKVVWMVFRPEEKVPIRRGDSVVSDLSRNSIVRGKFDNMHKSKGRNGIPSSGNSHMNMITVDGGAKAVGGNVSKMAKEATSKGPAYYKRVKVVGKE